MPCMSLLKLTVVDVKAKLFSATSRFCLTFDRSAASGCRGWDPRHVVEASSIRTKFLSRLLKLLV